MLLPVRFFQSIKRRIWDAYGIKAGKSAGCIVFGLTTSLPREALIEAGADRVFDSYEEIREKIW